MLLGVDAWRQAFERCVWSLGVVIDPPVFDDVFGLCEVLKEVFVQAFVAQPAVKAFHKCVLHRLAGLDVVPACSSVLAPSQHGV